MSTTDVTQSHTHLFSGHSEPLSREEATALLHRLNPSTPIYRIFQDTLSAKSGIREIIVGSHVFKVDCTLHAGVGGFGSAEHIAIGKDHTLGGLPPNPTLLQFGDVQVKFEEIIALAGDYFGVYGAPISLPGGSPEEKTERFKAAFQTLAQAPIPQIRQLMREIRDECASMSATSLPRHCYSSEVMQRNEIFSQIVPNFTSLLVDNSDHFEVDAITAYTIGHELAIKTAREAQGDVEQLTLAYAYDAFACHFLTDLFAAGHIRNQRGALEKFFTTQLGISPYPAKVIAGLLTAAQHEKDGKEGLNIQNGKSQWWAYGDGCFFTPQNEENKQKARDAVKQSLDDVYQAFAHPQDVTPPLSTEHIPWVIKNQNRLPLYSVSNENQTLILHTRTGDISVTSLDGIVNDVIPHIAQYLPQSYVSEYLSSKMIAALKIAFPMIEAIRQTLTGPIAKQIFFQVGRLGCLWEVVGIASAYQVSREATKLNSKIDEMANGIQAIYDDIQKIRQKLEEIDAKFNRFVRSEALSKVTTGITWINERSHEYQTHKTLDDGLKAESARILWNAYIKISTEFTNNGERLFKIYREMLVDKDKDMSEEEIKLECTLWFRQILDYQQRAMNLRTMLKISLEGGVNDNIEDLVREFEANILNQTEINKEYIDVEALNLSQRNIRLEIRKSTAMRIANQQLALLQ